MPTRERPKIWANSCRFITFPTDWILEIYDDNLSKTQYEFKTDADFGIIFVGICMNVMYASM